MKLQYAENSIIRAIAEYNEVYWFYMYFYNGICFLGVIGIVFSAIVLLRPAMKSSPSYLLFGLTFFDGSLLLTNFVSFGLGSILFYKVDHSNPWIEFHLTLFFRVLYPLNKTAYTGSVYTTIVITLERYFAVCHPFRARRNLTPRRAIYSITFVFLFSILFNFTRWFEFVAIGTEEIDLGVGKDKIFTQEIYLSQYILYRKYYLVWIWTAVMYIVPLTIVAVLNFRIYLELKWTTSIRENLNSSHIEETSVTKLLLIVVAVFTLCNLTNCFLFFLPELIGFKNNLPAEMELITSIPIILNSSFNFIIYCVVGRKFRNELIQIIPSWLLTHWKSNSHRRNQEQPSEFTELKEISKK